ncbi:hypothetical protein BPLS_P0409 [Bathymodiolus platifrons methanotrophic gill symbiont]|uniref:phage terminase large subunit n=1 Tax=Bathymodiolus platifrons methanotrophic gill symbiont TaxID=113268 RepID=UPI001B3E17A6|nr:phage terminase large subunit [Bathymodiolus platifrons methanotrophic gill symbiont]GFO74010.1 hypothetical protein BPLS_P0409 [Bathymodiolus platifrons methanotrophic gill symbiont]
MTNNKSLSFRQYQSVLWEDLSSFIQFTFTIIEPHTPYSHNAHIDLIADHLMQSHQGEARNLIINMPPRMMKSLSASVAYPAWVLGKAPQTKIMCVSYSEDLARDLSMKTQQLMKSREYQAIFPGTQLSDKRQTLLECHTTSGGGRYAVSTGGAIAGLGADIIIIDDPIKPSDANGKRLESCNRWFSENIYQRLNNKNTGAIIVVMQRVHENDLTGFLLEKKTPWQYLCLPAIAESDESRALKSGGHYYRKQGDALHPERESLKQLDFVKYDLGSYVFAGQYQQQPAPEGESIVKRAWFNEYHEDELPNFDLIIQSWDTAMTENESSDYSVGMTIGYIKDGYKNYYYILDVIRKKMEYPKLLHCIRSWIHKNNHHTHKKVIVEDIGSGKAIIQSLRNEGHNICAYKPTADKHTRLIAVTDILESGFVYLPKKAQWLDDFLLEVTRFPNAKHDDQVDALSQALNWLMSNYRVPVRVIRRPSILG